MIHFAYPNTKGERFIGCGRFAVFTLDDPPPAEEYDIADPECPSRAEIIDSASILAPEPVHPWYIIYERRDDPEQHYLGNSLGLAFLLALISRNRTLRFEVEETDIWCTGCVEIAGEQPIVKSVVGAGFEAKLEAFLAPENPDLLFIVPEANIDQHLQLQLNTRDDVTVACLSDFPRRWRLQRKTIVKVRRHELPVLVEVLFEYMVPVKTTKHEIPSNKNGNADNRRKRLIQMNRPGKDMPERTPGKAVQPADRPVSYLTRQEALRELRKYGIEGPQVYLIDLIPLVEMLWADGQAQVGEVVILSEYLARHVEHVNRIAGYELLTLEGARAFIKQFLQERPKPELLHALRRLIAPVRLSGSDTSRNESLRDSLLAACLDIASSSVTEYPYRHHDRFNLEEKQCFFEILESLTPC